MVLGTPGTGICFHKMLLLRVHRTAATLIVLPMPKSSFFGLCLGCTHGLTARGRTAQKGDTD